MAFEVLCPPGHWMTDEGKSGPTAKEVSRTEVGGEVKVAEGTLVTSVLINFHNWQFKWKQ